MKPHDYKKFASNYAQLEIKGTYYLAYRDIPHVIKKYVRGNNALDFGCGAGRSTRLLKKLGFDTIGVDISKDMVNEARRKDPKGKYCIIQNSKLPFKNATFDIILSCIVFMEIASKEQIIRILKEMKRVLKPNGLILIVVHSDDIYQRKWTSFIWKPPKKKPLDRGQKVKVSLRGTNINFYDYHWTNKDYLDTFIAAKLYLVNIHKPLAKGDEPFKWISETRFPYWIIYVLRK